MIDPVITPVVLPTGPLNHSSVPVARRALPLPSAPPARTSTALYGMTVVDSRGRIADHTIVSSLGWKPNTGLEIRVSRGLLLIRPALERVAYVTKHGYFRLPAEIRHSCGIQAADRVLLVADPERGLLVIYPPATLDNMISPCHANLLDGELS